jgi:hypothetical protein
LAKLWSLKLFATAIETPPELNFGRGVFHSDLQTLNYHQDDMHTQYLTNEEDIGFPKVSIAKKLPEFNLELNTAKLEIMSQLHLGRNLDKECSIVFYNPCATILMTCTS